MTLKVLVLALFALRAMPAFALPPPPLPPIMQGPMIRTATPGVTPDGITVRGAANLTTPATAATLTLNINAKQRNGTLTPDDVKPVVDALVQAGVAASDVQLPMYFTAGMKLNYLEVKASVQHPTLEMIQHGIALLGGVFANSQTLWLQNAMVSLRSDDCASVQRQAEDAALRDARAQAEHLASQLHLHLGAVLSAEYQGASGSPYGTACTAGYQLGSYGNMPASLQEYLTIHVYGNVTMRFAIK